MFWSCSLKGWDRAVAGYRKANSVEPQGMTKSRYEKLKSRLKAEGRLTDG